MSWPKCVFYENKDSGAANLTFRSLLDICNLLREFLEFLLHFMHGAQNSTFVFMAMLWPVLKSCAWILMVAWDTYRGSVGENVALDEPGKQHPCLKYLLFWADWWEEGRHSAATPWRWIPFRCVQGESQLQWLCVHRDHRWLRNEHGSVMFFIFRFKKI